MAGDFSEDFDAIAAIEAVLNGPEAPAPDETPTPQGTAPEIQPQEPAETQPSNEGVNASEEAKAPVVETTAPVAAEVTTPQPEAPKLAEQRLSPETSATPDPNAAINQTLQNISSVVQLLQAEAQGKFSDLKTEADVLALMQTDPTRYNEFVITQTKLNRAVQAQQFAQNEANKSYIAGEQQRLLKAIPDLADPEKGDALKAKLRAYAKAQGIPDNRQARSADEVIRLHREMTLADENAAFKSEKAAQAARLAEASKKAAGAPPVQKPGTQRETNKDDKASTDYSRFQKSGRQDDLAAYLQNIL